ncbi:hypothetical protein EHQ12_08000 [Leptospira gomenensis]|uniref:Uncharacterized protein n=1 Tax=Leptospira gomenensis TaxID=2484974 RepID=A0A5F1YDS1_9LEPT|nr:hypothetical protein [Leptospira gomenensis]TGK36086.1 hypothetical protein EHQ17_05295 [Leptospira gomenensis]TGK40074.1 hypothetical protein EHQ12_08000 [Leptospira gomenensis]TGK51550.1 hypothetical protein EHQ07_02390 [Leptospira gomenensis]TGK64918.1 hypothetical protein EHQ13_06565 [Leptospira gomenensis]
MKRIGFRKIAALAIGAFSVSGNVSASSLNFLTKLPIQECFATDSSGEQPSDLFKSTLPLEEKKRLAESIALQEGKSRYKSVLCIQDKKLSEEEYSVLLEDWNRHLTTYAELNSYYENYVLSDEKTRSLNSIEWELLNLHLKQKRELTVRMSDAVTLALKGEKISEDNFTMIYLSLFLVQLEFWDAMPKAYRDNVL